VTGTSQAAAARELGVPRSTVRDWIAQGKVQLRNKKLTKRAMDQLRQLAGEREESQEDEEESGDLRHQLLQAQVRERRAIGKLRELELAHESGRFVELALVQRDGEDTAERVLSILRAIPQRTALALECSCQRAAVVEQRISEEIERAIAEMKDSTYMNPRSKR
jgi:phage terminase Nu1 subunit (DNA packaging protein)